MKKTSIAMALAMALVALTGCSQQDATSSSKTAQEASVAARLDQAGLIAAVGSPVVREYSLDDGKGFSFLSDKCGKSVCGPDFSLEFRKGRVNVHWESFKDDSGQQFATMNAENLQWAARVLTYALGEDASNQLLESAKNGQPVRDGKFSGKRVSLSTTPSSALVQIYL